MSPETQAIIDKLENEGLLLRNRGKNSIKTVKDTVKVELGKFAGIFNEMKGSLTGLSEQSAANIAIAEEEAKLRGLSEQERLDYIRTQGEMEQRKQELENERLKREEKSESEKKKSDSVIFNGVKGLFSGITGFFKKWGLVIAGLGLPFAYEFVAGMLKAKFGIELPTVMEGVKNLGKFLTDVPWAKLSSVIIDTIAILVGFRLALGALNLAIAGVRGGAALLGRGSLLPGGTPPLVGPPAPGGTAPAGGGPGLLRRVGGAIAGNKGKAALAALSMLGVARVTGGTDDTTLDATAGQEDLLAAINERDTSLMEVLSETASSAAIGGAIGGAGGLVAGGVTAVPGAIAGAISGAIWGFATTVALGAKRAYDDSSFFNGEGIDELPNSVEEALREEKAVFEAGMEGRVEAIRASAQASKEFLNQNQIKLEETLNEIANIQDQINTEGTSEGLKSSLKIKLSGLNNDAELLQRQIDVTTGVLEKRNEQLIEVEKQTNESINDTGESTGSNIKSLEQIFGQMNLGQTIDLIAQGGLGSPQQYVFNKGGDVTNVQNTNAQRQSTVAVRQNMSGFGYGGSNSYEAIPGMFA